MKKNENIEFTKSIIPQYFKEYEITFENFSGPHWHLEFNIQQYQIKIFGDIGFQLSIIEKGKEYNLSILDKDLIGKQKTTFENIKCHLASLKNIVNDS